MEESGVDRRIGLRGAAAQALRVLDRTPVRHRPRRDQRCRRHVGTGQTQHLMAAADELAHDGRADEPGRSGDKHAHTSLSSSSGRGLRVDRLRMTCRVITVDRMACRVIYDRRMGRWEPDARDRLEHAALELFLEHGFDRVTVPEITARAGLTTRTLHRHFADKREVLFADADQFPTFASRLVLQAPAHLGPIDVVAQGLPTLATAFEGRLEQLKLRKAIIDTHDGLRERELRKMEALVDAITNAFRDRGVDDRTAAVVAETAVGVVKVALRRWIASTGQEPLHTIMTDSLTRIGGAFHQFHPR